jgi:hypothetical protein
MKAELLLDWRNIGMKRRGIRYMMEELATCVVELPTLAVLEPKRDERRADCGLERAALLAPCHWVAGRGWAI